MDVRDFKTNIYTELATITKAMANSHRLEVIELLAQGPCSVEYIAENTRLSIANASQHLQVLKKARLAKAEKKGKYNYYSLTNSKVYEVWKSLREFGFTQNAEIQRLIRDFRNDRQSLETVSLEDLHQRMEDNEVLVLDVRPDEEYKEGHIPGAISIPTKELEERMKDLPKDKQIVAYCRGPLCAMADDAVELLKQHGFESKRLEEGYPEWMLQNLSAE
ncbi:ArsR/SmtB family transcription factor [Fodinibius sp. AD559]|uniref:ArsR/SmtB family transcription factor n=1 Tax=Fodinibius sp. AD559 TaxID=3424179 RepID=UPI004046EF39